MQFNTVFKPVSALIQIKPNFFYHTGVFIISFLWIFYLSSILSPRLFSISLDDFWFDADVPRYICQVVDRFANDHWRNKIHPLFSLLTYPLPNILTLFGIDIISAIRLQLSLVVAVGSMFLSLTFQRLQIAKVDSFLLIAIALSGSTSLAWFTIPESYAFSFSAFCLMLFLSSSTTEKSARPIKWVGAIGLAFSITVTNIVVAMWAAIQSLGVRRALGYMVISLATVFALSVAQRLLFPSSGLFFLPSVIKNESSFFVSPSLERLRQVLSLFFLGSVVFPDVQLVNEVGKRAFMTVQRATWGNNSLLPIIAIVLLSGLLLAGSMTIASKIFHSINVRRMNVFLVPSQSDLERLSFTVAGSVFFIVFLHLFYGTETFVYSGSFLPFLILILAMGVGRFTVYSRFLTTGLLSVLLLTSSMHGMREWSAAVVAVRIKAATAPTEKAMARNTCAFVKRQRLF